MREIFKRGYSGCTDKNFVSEEEKSGRLVARKAAEEGIVLLKNDGVLPLDKDVPLAVFGGGALHTEKSGIGSGEVNNRGNVSIADGLKACGFNICDNDWLDDYQKVYENSLMEWTDYVISSENIWNAYTGKPFRMPAGRKITADDVKGADCSLCVISRTAGEGCDRKAEKGDFFLTDNEKRDIEELSSLGQRIILIINTGSIVDITEAAENENVKGILYIGQPGMEGGSALASILSGAVSPSGKLTDTWAESVSDYPGTKEFIENASPNTIKYTEGIFVGYRYFDMFKRKKVLFPFGFGLSYTDFLIKNQKLSGDTESGMDKFFTVSFLVKNIGEKYSGKCVVQIYAACPVGKLDKELKRLIGFAKTSNLKPGEEEKLSVEIPVKNLASFSEDDSAWIIEKGCYRIYTGQSSDSIELIGSLSADRDYMIERTSHILPLQKKLKEKKAFSGRGLSYQKKDSKKLDKLQILKLSPSEYSLPEYREDDTDREAEKIASELSLDQMLHMITGETGGKKSVVGSAGLRVPGSAGETSHILYDKNVGSAIMADGPSGLRLAQYYEVNPQDGKIYMDFGDRVLMNGLFDKTHPHAGSQKYYQFAAAYPVGTVIAQSWNTEIAREVGESVGREMEHFGISWWLAPGMNIHRNPLCGRNFEYYSEDPLISGKIAAAITLGVQSNSGVGTTIKHFACNNREDNRGVSDSVVSERAFREIYARGFEIAVKESQPMAVMTSYNRINGIHSANSRDLCTTLLREEWGFKGIVMTDWCTTMFKGGSDAYKCVSAGNDLMMPGSLEDISKVKRALKAGKINEKDLRDCVERLVNVILRTNCYKEAEPYNNRFERQAVGDGDI